MKIRKGVEILSETKGSRESIEKGVEGIIPPNALLIVEVAVLEKER